MTADDPDRLFLSQLTILHVEDDRTIREQMGHFLGRRAGRLLLAEDGEEGLRVFEAERPDVVVTDLMMPKMDGLALTAEIRRLSLTVPVIVVTAFERPDYLRRSIELGVDQYVMKPVEPEALDHALRQCARRLRAERELARQQRRERELADARHAEAMGLLAGGMAHDYNNLLQSILGGVSLAVEAGRQGQDPLPFLTGLEHSFAEAHALGRRLALLQRHRLAHAVPASIAPVLRAAAADGLAGTAAEVACDLPDDLPLLRFDERQLRGVLAAIVRNAAEAMGNSGQVRVTAGRVVVGDADALAVPDGAYVCCRVSDSGRGIQVTDLPFIFEPYWSGKAAGATKGQGLSLAVARAILALHGGTMAVRSTPDQGTEFSVYLPIVEGE